MIDENYAWDLNPDNAINKPLLSYGFEEETNEVEVEEIVDILVEVKVVADIPDIVEVEEEVASTSHRPQRTRVRRSRLQGYDVTGDDEVTLDRKLVYFALLAGAEPINYSEALKSNKWKLAMVEESEEIERNNTWELFKLPTHTKVVKVMWVFKLKHNVDGSIARHKARLVARGFLQREGLD